MEMTGERTTPLKEDFHCVHFPRGEGPVLHGDAPVWLGGTQPRPETSLGFLRERGGRAEATPWYG